MQRQGADLHAYLSPILVNVSMSKKQNDLLNLDAHPSLRSIPSKVSKLNELSGSNAERSMPKIDGVGLS